MARFDIYPSGDGGFVLDVQTNLLGGLNTRLVVPLMPPEIAPVPGRKLNPTFIINGAPYVMVTQFLAAVPAASLGKPASNLDDHYDEIVAAIDMILLGF